MHRLLVVLVACSSPVSQSAPPSGSGSSRAPTSGSGESSSQPAAVELATRPLLPDPDGLFTTHFPLGNAPALPPAFGKLRPWLTTDELRAARPAEWGNLHWREHGKKREGGIRWGYTRISDAKYHRVTELTVSFERADTRRRLIEAWGPPFTRRGPDSLHDDEACWIALTAKLRACHRHGNFIGGVSDWVTFLALQPLTDALATASSLAPEKLGGYLGKTRPQLEKLFPDQLDDKLLSKTNPAVVHFFASTEYRMSWLPDTLLFDFVDGKVVRVVLAFESDDKARARELRDRVTAVAKRAEGPKRTVKVAGWAEAGSVSIVVEPST